MSKRLDQLQACGRGNRHGSGRGLAVWVWLSSLRANVQREAAACPSEIQRQIRMRGSLSPCCLCTLCLQLHVHASGQQKHSRGVPGFQPLAAGCVWASNNFSAVLRRAGISAASSELRDRLRATPPKIVTSTRQLPALYTRPSIPNRLLSTLQLSLLLTFRLTNTTMTGRGGGRAGGGGRRVLLPPINFIFKLLQQHSIVQIWLYEQVRPTRIILKFLLLETLLVLGALY